VLCCCVGQSSALPNKPRIKSTSHTLQSPVTSVNCNAGRQLATMSSHSPQPQQPPRGMSPHHGSSKKRMSTGDSNGVLSRSVELSVIYQRQLCRSAWLGRLKCSVCLYICLTLTFDVSVYYVEVENGALLCDVTWSWKMILGCHGEVMEFFFGGGVGTVSVNAT